MTAAPPAAVEARRVLSPEDATLLVGSRVPQQVATITAATVARDAQTGRPVFAYLPVDGVEELRAAVRQVPWTTTTFRTSSGSRNVSRTFGYRPRKPYMKGGEACSRAALSNDAPGSHRILEAWSSRLGDALRSVFPEIADADAATAAAVLPDWRFGEAEPWTSGVVNRTSTLPYHRDRNNFPVWSAMPVVRRHVSGGHLAIPEYGAVIECRDGHALFFPGYELVHGVTPLKVTREGGYRISVVYYSLRGLKDCFTAAAETAYGTARRTTRERDMASRIAKGDRGIPGRPARPRSGG